MWNESKICMAKLRIIGLKFLFFRHPINRNGDLQINFLSKFNKDNYNIEGT